LLYVSLPKPTPEPAPTKGGGSRLGILKELTKNPVNITAANAPAGTKVITFTRGEKFFETSLLKLK